MPLQKVYRAGIIGCGWIGTCAMDSHARSYRENPRIRWEDACDLNAGSAKGQSIWWYRLYDDYVQMVRIREFDIVSVCTPASTHAKIVCDIAPYVKAIYCEKPIALSLEDADRMIETCHKYGVILQINHQRRFINPKFTFARDIVDTGTHAFDRLRQLFGEPTEITATKIRFPNIDVDLEYTKSDEHIFNLDCVRSKEPMIPLGVQHLIECLDEHKESISSGEEARKTLSLVLKFKELNERG